MDIIAAALTIFLLIDPIGNIPVFLATMKSVPRSRQKKIVLRELLIALVVLMFFLLAGRFVLQLLQLSHAAIQLSGGVVLFLIAINMAFPSKNSHFRDLEDDGEPFIVPLAVPLVAGPSTIAVLILLSSKEPEKWLSWVAALLLAWLIAVAVLMAAVPISKALGKKGLLAMERLVGMLLIMLSIQMLLDGAHSALPSIIAP